MRAFFVFVALLVGLVVGSFVVGMDGPRVTVLPFTAGPCSTLGPDGQPTLVGCPGGPTP